MPTREIILIFGSFTCKMRIPNDMHGKNFFIPHPLAQHTDEEYLDEPATLITMEFEHQQCSESGFCKYRYVGEH